MHAPPDWSKIWNIRNRYGRDRSSSLSLMCTYVWSFDLLFLHFIYSWFGGGILYFILYFFSLLSSVRDSSVAFISCRRLLLEHTLEQHFVQPFKTTTPCEDEGGSLECIWQRDEWDNGSSNGRVLGLTTVVII